MFSVAQALTVTAVSEKWIDFSAYRDIGEGAQSVEVFIAVDEAADAAGAATLTITLECDDNSSFTSATTLATTAAIGKASLVIGYNPPPLHGLKIPSGCERFLRLNYTVATGPLTAGKVTAGLVLAHQSARAYPNITL